MRSPASWAVASRASRADALESWSLDHATLGRIDLHVGTSAELRDVDPDFPEASDTHILVLRDGEVTARIKHVINQKVPLDPEVDTKGFARQGRGRPFLDIEVGFLGRWVREVRLRDDDGVVLVEPPEGARAWSRYREMEASPWKRVAYPLAAGLGKGGWALFLLVVLPVLRMVSEAVHRWLAPLVPDVTLPQIRWPSIPWPHIPWPDIPWPEWTAPGWVQLLVEYERVWVPVVVGVVIGVLSLRRHRQSQARKREWDAGAGEQNQPDAIEGEQD